MSDDSKRQELPHETTRNLAADGFYVVATPIGNLSDMTDRARQVLSASDVVFCEDTRQGMKLFSALGISGAQPRFERVDAHASDSKIRSWADRMKKGGRFAFISDAGSPGISDPGAKLVRAAREAGVPVVPVPGPSALMALLSIAGFDETAFVFRGFFPRKRAERERELSDAKENRVAAVFVWFESPLRIEESLATIAHEAPDAEIVVAKEISKIHERFFSGGVKTVAQEIAEEISREGERGEWCFVVKFSRTEAEVSSSEEKSSEWVKALHCLLDARVSASEAVRQVCQHFGAPRKIVYEMALKLSGKKD